MVCRRWYEKHLAALLLCTFSTLGFSGWIDLTDQGGTITASSQIHERESKEMAFDNTTSTKWLTGSTPTGWIQFQFPQGNRYTIRRYSIASANDAPERDPRSWTLSGSNDGTNWVVVDTRDSQSWSGRYLRREFECAHPNAFNIYRLTITGNNGSPNLTGFSEMELIGFSNWIDRTDYGGIVTASSQIHEGESKEMAFDNTTSTKWLTYFTPTGWIQFQFPQGNRYVIGCYSITSANDAPERDPRSWTLYGSNDEKNWTVVDTRDNQSWSSRFLRREFVCAYPGAFNYYRLDITSNNGSTNLTGFSEMELLEETFIAENPSPANMARNIAMHNLVLSWGKPEGISNPTYRIYLDTSLSLVQSADPSVLQADQSENSVLIASLDSFTTYYWRVDVVGNNTVYIGTLWQFQTQLPDVPCLRLLTDIDYDCEVGLSDLVIMASQWLSESFPSDYHVDLDHSAKVDAGDLAVIGRDWSATAETIILSEIMADNETTLSDNFGEFSDWIEIKNLGNTPCNLQGWFLTDNKKVSNKWSFPDVTIDAKGTLIVFASERNLINDPNYLHTNFRLGSEGEYLALIRPNGTIAHEFAMGYPTLGNDESYGMTVLPGEDILVASLLAKPTPGQNNAAAVVSVKPTYSRLSGLFTASFSVEISVSEPECQIRYTLDGSIPSATSTIYTGPLTIAKTTCIRAAAFKAKYIPGKTSTRSYIFLADAIQQPALPEGFPSMWKNVAADYQMAPDIITHATYGPLVQPSLLSIPTLSIVTSLNNLFDPSTGIYVNPLQEGVTWERPVSMEIIQPGSSEVFQIDCGLRIQGGAFRSFDLTKKKSFRLLFKKDYGQGKLNYPLFDDPDAVLGLDTLVLRAGANDGYSWSSARLTEQYIRDEFGRSLQRDSGNAGAHGTFVHLYLNGLYWGLYNAVERPDHAFGAAYYGGSKDDWDAINSGDITNGNMTAWNTLLSKCRAGLSTMAAYHEIQGNNPDGSRNPAYPNLIDVANYIDYMIINFWGGNGDWPWRNYWMGRLQTEASTGFKFYCWDYESTIGSPFAVVDKVSGNNDQGVGELHRWLKENAEYRMLFADRLHRLFFHNGILTPNALVQRYSALADWVEPAIVAESARWGDMHYQPSLGLNEWLNRRNWILNTYLPSRSQVVLEQMRNNGFYPQLNAPVFRVDNVEQHGGYFNTGQTLSIICPQTPSAPIWYTTDGNDPRLPGGIIHPSAVRYTEPWVLSENLPIKARSLSNNQWSALNEAVFVSRAALNYLRITELMYNPSPMETSNFETQDYEYIELANIGTAPLRLNGVTFTEGIDYAFPNGVSLAIGGYLILAKNPAAFQGRYTVPQGVTVLGGYDGQLANSGESLTLLDAAGGVIHHFVYNNAWLPLTDGVGFSLTKHNPAGSPLSNWNEKLGWRASSGPDGSPGQDDVGLGIAPGDIVINEILAYAPGMPDWVELHNTTDEDISIGGWFLSDKNVDDEGRRQFEIPPTVLPAGGYRVFYENTSFGNPEAEGCLHPFGLSRFGETVYLFSGQNGQITGHYYTEESFGVSEAGVSFGRHYTEDGREWDFTVLSAMTPGDSNADPLVGPVVIREIMYHPAAGGAYDKEDYEYIELRNTAGYTVPLEETDAKLGATFPWKLSGGVDFDFPTGAVLPAGEVIVVVRNIDAFRSRYPAVPTDKIYGPYSGQLNNAGETIKLLRPGQDNDGVRAYLLIDRVAYSNGLNPIGQDPWPPQANGGGMALSRISDTQYGNDPANWQALPPTPGQTPANPVAHVLHYWHFNDLAGAASSVNADYSLPGNALITYPGSGNGFMDTTDGSAINARLGQGAGNCLRVRNPSATRQLLFVLPTTGYRNLRFSYATMRTTFGAQTQQIEYRTSAAGSWLPSGESFAIPESYQLFTLDFSAIPAANNNPEFAVRILFGGSNASAATGNNRFDNVVLEGTAISTN